MTTPAVQALDTATAKLDEACAVLEDVLNKAGATLEGNGGSMREAELIELRRVDGVLWAAGNFLRDRATVLRGT